MIRRKIQDHMNCISCQGSSFVLYSETSDMQLPVYKCTDCSLLFTGSSEIEIKKKTREIYSGNYWEEREAIQSLESNFRDKVSVYKWKHWKSQVEYCKPYLQDKKDLLEIGSGAGQSLFYFEKMGFNVMGIEPDSRNVEILNQKLKQGHCINGFIEETEIAGSYDVIWISHVFEHLIRPNILLKRCREILRDNGIIFIEIPECENPKILKQSIYENPSTFHFTKKTLSNVVQNVGYKIIKCDSFRVPTLVEAGMMKIMKRFFNFIKYNPYPYYPRIITKINDGQLIRMILVKF